MDLSRRPKFEKIDVCLQPSSQYGDDDDVDEDDGEADDDDDVLMVIGYS